LQFESVQPAKTGAEPANSLSRTGVEEIARTARVGAAAVEWRWCVGLTMYLGGGQTIEQIIAAGVKVPQDISNKLGSFDQQSFRLAAVMWLVDLHIEIEKDHDNTWANRLTARIHHDLWWKPITSA
jgi:hypothetical protein